MIGMGREIETPRREIDRIKRRLKIALDLAEGR